MLIKFKFLKFLVLSALIIVFLCTSEKIFASCIPPSSNLTSGCAFGTSGSSICYGYNYQLVGGHPYCASDFNPPPSDIFNRYHCQCNYSYQLWNCPSGPVMKYSPISSSIGSLLNACECTLPPSQPLCAVYPYNNLTYLQATNSTECDNWCRNVISVPTSTPLPAKVVVSGVVKNSKTGLPVAGARILVQKTDDKYGFCVGQHWGCSPDYVFTDSTGKWTSSCIDTPMKSIFVKEVNNATGFIDSSRYPDPAGATVWDKNTVCYQNVAGKTNIGPIVFYDLK